MIEIGKNFWWGLSNAKQSARQEKEKNNLLATQAQQQAKALQQAYEEKMEYLFRSATERTQLALDNARKQLALLQAKRAANGVLADSATAVDEKQTADLQQTQQQKQVQQELQTRAAEENNVFERKWNELRQAVTRYRKQARSKGRLGSFGRAVLSLFN